MTRPEELVEAIREAAVLGEESVITICQGPPRCGLQGDAAVDAMLEGCLWCRQITIHADGSETTAEPASV